MLHHVFSLLCQSASIDQLSNSLSVLNVIEKLEAHVQVPVQVTSPFTGIPFEHQIVTLWFNDDGSDIAAKQRLDLVLPTGQRVQLHEVNFTVLAAKNHRMVARLRGIPYAGDGVYWTEVSVQQNAAWDVVARMPLVVEMKVVAPLPEAAISH